LQAYLPLKSLVHLELSTGNCSRTLHIRNNRVLFSKGTVPTHHTSKKICLCLEISLWITGIKKMVPTRIRVVKLWFQNSFQFTYHDSSDFSLFIGFLSFLEKKIAIYLSLGLYKGRPSYRRRRSALKREHPALQKRKFINIFSIFVGNFCPPGSGSGLRIRIRIRVKGLH
jgi:hypothetical protein